MNEEKSNFAEKLEDYRHLYKFYLTDPDLQEARARWPFICVWDDHEFTDDCWQSQANYTRPETADERRLPIAAAAGGMAVPALVYLAATGFDPALIRGWAA